MSTTTTTLLTATPTPTHNITRVYNAVCQTYERVVYADQEVFDLWRMSEHQVAWSVAALCVLVSVGMSFSLMYRHILHYRRPEQQRHIIRILLMVPIYSICSFLSLRFVHRAVYFDAVRSCYEAFVIYSFYALLLNYLGPDYASQKAALQKKPDGRYPFPFGFIFYNPRSGGFLKACMRGTLQYALIHPVTSFLTVTLEMSGVLCPENMGWGHPMIYLLSIEMVSVMVAMYYLVLFYVIVKEDVTQYKVLKKFIAVKFVLFFSFWQSVLLSMLASAGFLRETDFFTVANISVQVQNFLICIEMVIASVMHANCFSSKEYEGYQTGLARGIRDVILPTDLIADTRTAIMVKRKPKSTAVEMGALAGSARTSSAERHGAGASSNTTTRTSSPSRAGGRDRSQSPGRGLVGRHHSHDDDEEDQHHRKRTGGRGAAQIDSHEETSLIANVVNDESDLGDAGRRDSVDTNPDMAEDEMDEEENGVGIIRLNPTLEITHAREDSSGN